MNILSKDFTRKSLITYAFPTILMMIFLSTYTIVDGLFVAHYVGEDGFAALNIVWPVFNVVLAIGLMFATGGTAVMGRLMGQGRDGEARSFLSILYLVAMGLGVVVTLIIQLFCHEITLFLGVEADLYDHGMAYLRTLGFFATSYFLQVFVQSFFVLAGKPTLGFLACFAGGLTNIFLDYLFISPHLLNFGVTGAALATGLGNCVPSLFGLFCFIANRKGTLYFGRPVFHGKQLLQSIFNGSSELVGQLSTAVTSLLFNLILLNLVGTAGVASIGVILYIQMIQTALYLGYSMGVAPIISYKYGAGDAAGLRKVLQISLQCIAVISLAVIAFSLAFAEPAVAIFISPDSTTFAMATHGLRLFSIAYLFMGFNVFVSAMFTALSNGAVSALLSVSRTLVFLVTSLLILPYFFHLNGVWLAVPLAESLAFLVALFFYRSER